jgi:hypothetical protein
MDRVVNLLNNRYLLAVMALLFVIGVMRRVGR